MTPQALQFINDRLSEAGLNYHFARYNYDADSPLYPYAVGSYRENDAVSEDGRQEAIFTVSAWTRGPQLELELVKGIVRTVFPVYGRTEILDGSGVAVSYLRAQLIPTGDSELKRMDITLHVKEWSE
jgi:hypothetical protein